MISEAETILLKLQESNDLKEVEPGVFLPSSRVSFSYKSKIINVMNLYNNSRFVVDAINQFRLSDSDANKIKGILAHIDNRISSLKAIHKN
mmetsp:Transcript_11613/g.13345  ORF Transcript_11613/g.13345 Transcript_11613/m.13345 type:complete len:91 (-) Transcript_11613:700-972(-)